VGNAGRDSEPNPGMDVGLTGAGLLLLGIVLAGVFPEGKFPPEGTAFAGGTGGIF